MALGGFVRNRKHQFGRQTTFGTKVAAKRAYPFKGVPTVDLKWTDPDVDVGAIDPVVAPNREAPDVSAALTDPRLTYNSLPILLSGVFGDNVTPSGGGTAKTWTYAPASTTVDVFDPFTYEFGDDVVTDWFQLGDGTLENVEISGPEGLGALTTSMTWRFGSASSTGSTDSPVDGSVPTALDVAVNEAIVYLKDAAIYIDNESYVSPNNQVSDALHSFTLRISQPLDLKRFANGDQSFDVDAYGRGLRAIELECTWAKTPDTVGTGSEADAWFSDEAVSRYVSVVFESLVEAQSGVPNSWVFSMPMRYYTRADSEIGGNTVVVLTGHAFYDPEDFDGVFKSVVVNTLPSADL